jgi:hypothetical protein
VITEQIDLDALVHTFATEWLRLGDSQLDTQIVADAVLVLGPEGTTPVPRSAFLAAVTARATAVKDSSYSTTTLARARAQALGDRMVLATISWSFNSAETTTTLVSDFLLQREAQAPLRCVAYLPRTNVLDQLE